MPKLVGKPIKIAEFKMPTYGTDWLAFLHKIPIGYLQETDANYGTLQTAIARLEKGGKVKHGEYAARSRTIGDKARVYVFHNAGTENKQPARKHKTEGPSNDEVEKHILSQPTYENSLADIQKRFYGRVFSSRDDPKEYQHSYGQLVTVRKRIEAREKGKFTEERRNDGSKVYRFSKQES